MISKITNMRVERIRRQWTQDYVAKQVGVVPSQISSIENLHRRPGYEVLCRIESLFGKSHKELFAEMNNKPIPDDFITERKRGGVTTNG